VILGVPHNMANWSIIGIVGGLVGVVGGLIGVGVLIWQTTLLRKSTKAAEAAANAIMDTEGAVLIVQGPEFWPDTTRAASFTYRLGQVGKTSAVLFFENSIMFLSKSKDSPPDVSVYDKHAPNTLTIDHIVALQQDPPFALTGYFPERRPITNEETIAIRAGEMFLWACGVVRYRDVYKRAWERRFCYVWDCPPEDRSYFRIGPPEYNRLTRFNVKGTPVG